MKKGKVGELLKWWPLVGMILVLLIYRLNIRPRSFDQLEGAREMQPRNYYNVWISGWEKGKRYNQQGELGSERVLPLLEELTQMTYRKAANNPTYSSADGNYYNFCIDWYVNTEEREYATLTLTSGGYLRLDWQERWYRMNLPNQEIETFVSEYKERLGEALAHCDE